MDPLQVNLWSRLEKPCRSLQFLSKRLQRIRIKKQKRKLEQRLRNVGNDIEPNVPDSDVNGRLDEIQDISDSVVNIRIDNNQDFIYDYTQALQQGNNNAEYRKRLAVILLDSTDTFGKNLVKLLKSHHSFSFLPKNMRTLLSTPRISPVLNTIEPGEYLHIGVKACLLRILEGIPLSEIPGTLKLDFSTDGAKLTNTGKNLANTMSNRKYYRICPSNSGNLLSLPTYWKFLKKAEFVIKISC